jgi:hypothetical protein
MRNFAWFCGLMAVALFIACSGPALACTCGPGTTQQGDVCVANPTSRASQGQGQTQGQGQSQTAKGGNGGQGGAGGNGYGTAQSDSASASAASAAGNTTSYSESYTSPRLAVDGYSSGTNTTATCRYDTHGGLGTFIGGVSFGRGMKDHDCQRIALADSFYSRGNTYAAAKLYCSVRDVRDAIGGDCVATLDAPPPKPVTPAADTVSRADLLEIERRMLTHGVSK